ncbi:Alpha/Beta hydrolase protein [Tirmania nivea]|nr:Alpha/Beta hydrolase protein [Tirmania nivea]
MALRKTHSIVNKLGRITGAVIDGTVVQYRGIPYATIPGRFKNPLMKGYLGDFDATKWGAIAPQLPNSEEDNASILNAHLPISPPERKVMSELTCTNLVIVTPIPEVFHPDGHGTPKLLPVIVWAHGGAYRVGSANFTVYDAAKFAQHAAASEYPVVVVSLNRRLGTLGLVASEDVGAEGNYTLKDERLALEWVRKNIQEFGGDPCNVTYLGESAGSASSSIHLYSPTPLFNRAILLSGLAGLLPPRPLSAQTSHFRETLQKLGITKKAENGENTTATPSAEELQQFMDMSAEEVAKVAFDVKVVPTADGKLIPTQKWLRHDAFIRGEKTDGGLQWPDWCEGAMVGSCKDEYVVMRLGGKIEKVPDPLAHLRRHLSTVHPENKINKLLETFGISQTVPKDDLIQRMYFMISEYGFRRPAWDFVDHFSHREKDRKLYYAQMEMGSPFEGPNHGKAHHAIDIVFGLQNVNDQFKQLGGPSEQNKYIKLAHSLANSWLRYAYGKKPWTPYHRNLGGAIKIFDYEHSESVIDAGSYDDGLQQARWDVMKELGELDETWRVLQDFLNAPDGTPTNTGKQ